MLRQKVLLFRICLQALKRAVVVSIILQKSKVSVFYKAASPRRDNTVTLGAKSASAIFIMLTTNAKVLQINLLYHAVMHYSSPSKFSDTVRPLLVLKTVLVI